MQGSIDDVVWVFVTCFVAGIFLLLMTFAGFNLAGNIVNTTLTPESKGIVTDTVYSGFDSVWNIFPFIFFGMYFVAIILAYNVGSHPVFAIFSIILIAVDIIVASVLGYVYTSVANMPEMLPVIARYPVVDFIFQSYAFLFTVMAIGMFVVLYFRGGTTTGGTSR